MDDLTFRKRIYANPNDHEQDIINACNDDKAKAKFKSDMKQFDAQLKQAMNVKVPDNLAEKVLLSQSIKSQNKASKRTKIHLAIAASVAIFVGVLTDKFGLISDYNTVGEYALAHHMADQQHSFETNHYEMEDVNGKLAEYGVELINALPNVSFASNCYFARIKSLHLVLQGEKYPVTVFLVPNKTGLEDTRYFSDKEYNGESINVNDNQLLIITHKDDPKKDWSKEVINSIKGRTT